jgi:uncharacterized protein
MCMAREATDELLELVASFPVVVVSGARQVGKTTLLRHVFLGFGYVVFDASTDVENVRADPELFLQNHRPPLLLHEIQYAPEPVSALKRHVDRAEGRPGLPVVSGSKQRDHRMNPA